MDDFKNRKKLRRVLYSRPVLVVLGGVVVFVSTAAWNMYQTYRTAALKRDTAQGEYERLSERRDMLEQNIQKLKTPRGREERIREDFGLAKEGETVIVVTEPAASAQSVNTPAPHFLRMLWQRITAFFR